MSRIQELEALLLKADDQYRKGSPIMSDSEYDRLLGELKFLAPDSLVHSYLGGDTESTALPKELEDIRLAFGVMKSIRPAYSLQEAEAHPIWNHRILMMAKADGHAFDAYYRWGHLFFASPRARDGRQGRDITRQLSAALPTEISEWSDKEWVNVRGEAVITHADFELFCEKYADDAPSNARNSVSSILKDKYDPDDLRFLTCLCYNINYDGAPRTLSERIVELANLGFRTINAWNDFIDPLQEPFKTPKNFFEYETDGLVARVDDLDIFEELGGDEKYDYGQLALKYGSWENSIYESKIVEIDWSSDGRQNITPVAIIEPVYTPSGKEVKRVSLFNVANMLQHHIQIGTKIYFDYVSEINPHFLASEHTYDSLKGSEEVLEEYDEDFYEDEIYEEYDEDVFIEELE